MIVYLAGPIDTEKIHWKDEAKRILSPITTLYDPEAAWAWRDHGGDANGVIRINEAAIDTCDAVLAYWSPVSVGTTREIERAVSQNKPVFAYMASKSKSMYFNHDNRVHLYPHSIRDATEGVRKWVVDVELDKLPTSSHLVIDASTISEEIAIAIPNPLPPPLRVKRTSPGIAQTLYRHHNTDAGYDMYVAHDTTVPSLSFVDVSAGISVQLPPNTWGMITGRSSTIRKRGLLVTTGIIDNGFRGELFAGVRNQLALDCELKRGDRIAQLILFPMTVPPIETVDELDPSDRGEKGFGSTGE